MWKSIEIASVITLLVGTLADILFLGVFFFIPLVRHSLGMKCIMIGMILNIIGLLIEIIFVFLDREALNPDLCLIGGIINLYTLVSQSNWTIIYIYYLYRNICKKVEITYDTFKRFIIYEVIFTSLIVGAFFCGKYIYFESKNHWVCFSIFCFIYFIYFIFAIISFILSYKIYLELKKKYHLLKKQAIYDLLRLISFPLIMLFSLELIPIFCLIKLSGEIIFGIFIMINIHGLFFLMCLLLTQEMRDGIKLMNRRKARLISYL